VAKQNLDGEEDTLKELANQKWIQIEIWRIFD